MTDSEIAELREGMMLHDQEHREWRVLADARSSPELGTWVMIRRGSQARRLTYRTAADFHLAEDCPVRRMT